MRIADTNVVVGLVTGMTPRQQQAAEALVLDAEQTGQPIVVTEGVFVECEWVLRRRFGFSRPEVVGVMKGLLDSASFEAWDPGVANLALRFMESEPRLDSVDCILAAMQSLGEASVITFDRLLARTIDEYLDTT